ncbi:MAG: hypothetical protein M3437_08410 [Chloroflexota bacterium]|nr:hypothetical protein [Chloroflexota bacterium]MDQ5867128.1 hypothetical protein [Chloroflexota bacterium]
MADSTDIWLQVHKEEGAQARQSETQRAAVTNYTLVIAAAIAGYVVDQGFAHDLWYLTTILALIGFYGALASAKYYERFRYLMEIAREIELRLEAQYPDFGFSEVLRIAESKHRTRFPLLTKIRLNKIWLVMHLSIAFTGVATTLYILLY